MVQCFLSVSIEMMHDHNIKYMRFNNFERFWIEPPVGVQVDTRYILLCSR